ncbi:hypothetical protein F4802DRAFT_591126 [Xylaria palmicola]|nr:hypothetical protein F4802DRAFT_591126 [Xylaria palmicola]
MPQKEALSAKLDFAAAKAGPLDTDDLFKRLTEARDPLTQSQDDPVRSPTTSPPLNQSNARYETFCYYELLRTGGQPALPLDLLVSGSGDAQPNSQATAPWLGETGPSDGEGDVPPVFSTQLEDWMAFRQRWQWDNRGKAAGKQGFPAYLEWQRKMYLHKGEVDIVADPSFETTIKRIWDNEPTALEVSRLKGFAAYTQAVEKRLVSHRFTQLFKLSKDPRRQDVWTTWVEYLGYICWSHDQHAASMKCTEPQYRRAWEALESLDWLPSSSLTATTETVDQQLRALQMKMQNITAFLGQTRAYRRAEAACRRQELRIQWVLEQLRLVETGASETASRYARKKRRREGDQDDNEPRPQRKRTRSQTAKSASGLEPKADATAPSQGAAKLPHCLDASARVRPPEPKAGVLGTRRSTRVTGTQRKTCSSAPS